MSFLGILASLFVAWSLHGTSWAMAGYALAAATVWTNGILFNFSIEDIHNDLAPPWAVIGGPSSAITSFVAAVVVFATG